VNERQTPDYARVKFFRRQLLELSPRRRLKIYGVYATTTPPETENSRAGGKISSQIDRITLCSYKLKTTKNIAEILDFYKPTVVRSLKTSTVQGS
jgi:hypothetical protein